MAPTRRGNGRRLRRPAHPRRHTGRARHRAATSARGQPRPMPYRSSEMGLRHPPAPTEQSGATHQTPIHTAAHRPEIHLVRRRRHVHRGHRCHREDDRDIGIDDRVPWRSLTVTSNMFSPVRSCSGCVWRASYAVLVRGRVRRITAKSAGTLSMRIASAAHWPFFKPAATTGTSPRTKNNENRSTLNRTRDYIYGQSSIMPRAAVGSGTIVSTSTASATAPSANRFASGGVTSSSAGM